MFYFGERNLDQPLTSHVREAAEEESEEEIEDDQVGDEDGGQEVGDASRARQVHAVPHGLDPLAAQHPEHNHDAGKTRIPENAQLLD